MIDPRRGRVTPREHRLAPGGGSGKILRVEETGVRGRWALALAFDNDPWGDCYSVA